MVWRFDTLAAAAVLLVSTALCSPAQQTSIHIVPRVNPSAPPRADLRVDASLVQIPVQVTTQTGKPVDHLSRENFRIFEDSVEQPITHFSRDDAPVSVGLVFDSSGSMQTKMYKAVEAAAAFFRAANPEDEFFLVEFNERPRLAVGFNRDPEPLLDWIRQIRPYGRTSLFDAVDLALQQMKKARHFRKAIVVLSDGGDNRSRITLQQIRDRVVESDAQLYAMGIYGRMSTREEFHGPQLLDQLATATGGSHFRADHVEDLPEISARIAYEMRNQYLLGYAPPNGDQEGKYHRVRVMFVPAEETHQFRIHYRQGYFAPSE